MASITVKKNDGTTDQIWTNVQASGGDKSPAVWRNQSVGSAPLYQPEFKMMSRPNGDGTVRRFESVFNWAQTVVGSDGLARKVNVFTERKETVVPQGMPGAELAEAISQSANLHASALAKQALKDGFAPV